MNRQRRGTVLAVLVLSTGVAVACERAAEQLSPVAPTTAIEASQAAVISNETFYLNFTLNNPCTGEVVRWEGPLHVVMRSQSDNRGGYMVGWTQNAQALVGTGLTSGNTYRLVGVYTNQEHARPPFPVTINREFRRRWISQGNESDAYVFGHYRIVVDANGQVRLEDWQAWSIFAPECR